jgi:CRP-like cAMP-binding protein
VARTVLSYVRLVTLASKLFLDVCAVIMEGIINVMSQQLIRNKTNRSTLFTANVVKMSERYILEIIRQTSPKHLQHVNKAT